MDSLGTSDLNQLYNHERREMIKRMMDAAAVTSRVLRQGGADDTTITTWEEQSHKTLCYCIIKLKEKYFGVSQDNHSWIGINPPPGTFTMQELWDKVLALPGKYTFIPNTLSDMAFTVEQNVYDASGNLTKRPHIHLMIRGHHAHSRRPASIAKTLAPFFKVQPNFIKTTHFRKSRLFEEHLTYIKGDKQDKKDPLVQLDITDRESLGIPNFKLFS